MRDDNQDRPFDIELELAKQLEGFGESNGTSLDLPDSILDQLSQKEIQEFRNAQKCLELLHKMNSGRVPTFDALANDDTPHVATTSQSIERDSPELPARIDRFEILKELGRGGFGIVVLAKDPVLNRLVAIKVPRAHRLFFAEATDRFIREAKSAAGLSHPSIVPIFESGSDRLFPYIVSAYCPGTTLADWIRTGHDESAQRVIAPHLAARIIRTLADAVQHAHSRGVIHRDLKPANILVHYPEARSDDEHDGTCAKAPDSELECTVDISDDRFVDSLRITDFGLAQLLDESERITTEGALIGTPAYMPPERVDSSMDSGPSTDIYSLGVMLYELLTGRLPFEGETQLKLLKAISEQTAPNPRSIQRNIPRDLSAICLKCIEKSPRRRYANCQELVDDLDQFMSNRPVSARERNVVERAGYIYSRNPLLAATLTALILVLASATVVLGMAWKKAEKARMSADFHERQANVRAEEALLHSRQLRVAVNELLVAIANEPSLRSSGMEEFRARLLASATGFYQELSASTPRDKGIREEYLRTMLALAVIHQTLEDHDQAIEIAKRSIAMIEDYPPSDLQLASHFAELMSECQLSIGAIDDALETKQSAIEQARDASQRVPDSAQASLKYAGELTHAASLRLSAGDPSACAKLNGEAIAILNDLFGERPEEWPERLIVFQVLRTQAILYLSTGRNNEGKRFATLAQEVFEQIDSHHSFKDANSQTQQAELLSFVGLAAQRSGDFSSSETNLDRAIEILSEVCTEHPHVLAYQSRKLGVVYQRAMLDYAQQRIDESAARLHANLEDSRDVASRFNEQALTANQRRVYNTAIHCLNTLAVIERQRGEMELALDYHMEGIAICDRILAAMPEHAGTKSIRGTQFLNLASLHYVLNDYEQAKTCYADALEDLEAIDPSLRTPETRISLQNSLFGLFQTAGVIGDYPLQIQTAERFLDLAEIDDSQWHTVQCGTATAHAHLGAFNQSQRIFQNVESRCRTTQQFLSLAASIAECSNSLRSNSQIPSSPELDQFKDSSLKTCLRLIHTAIEQNPGEVSRDALRNEHAFRFLHDNEEFQQFLDLLN